MFENRSNNEKIVIALVGLVLFGALIESAPWLLIMLFIAGMIYYQRERNEEQSFIQRRPEAWEIERERPQARPVRRERPTNAEQIHQHALRAVRRAGLDPNQVAVLTTDVGLIAFHSDADPSVYRSADVPDDADYIQPFIELRVPVAAMGRVRFEIFDGGTRPVFVHEDMHQLQRGRNLISPASRLPVHDELSTTSNWELRVTADNVVVARHVFRWDEVASVADGNYDNPLNQHIGEDGEISNELRAIVAESRLGRMSLDELLSGQDEEDIDDAQQQMRRG